MENALIDALQITIVGMGLVFAAILLLWGMMAILVRITSASSRSVPKNSYQIGQDQKEEDKMELVRKRRAALAAVAIAYAQHQSGTKLHEFPLPPTPLVSAWQTVLRTRMIYKRGK
jgi:Na+-transporting methylmalonyl-CoA/oxaloacetate decarboxylase gamma subunit